MAKDDYYVIVYKILAYLYVQLKNGEAVDENLILHDGKLFQINHRYWVYILENMTEQGFINGISFTRPWGAETLVDNLACCQITPVGIDYLCNNGLVEKAKNFLKDIKDITPFI